MYLVYIDNFYNDTFTFNFHRISIFPALIEKNKAPLMGAAKIY
jgi:hypothetical protein